MQYALNPDSTVIPIARLAGITRAIITPEYPRADRRGGDRRAKRCSPGRRRSSSSAAATQLLVKPHAAMVVDLGAVGRAITPAARATRPWSELKEVLGDVRSYMRNKAAYERNQTRAYAVSKADLEALIPLSRAGCRCLSASQRASDIRLALKLARDEKLKIILDGADEGWLVANEIAAAHVPVIVNPTDDLPSDFERIHATMENAARLEAAGVEVIVANAPDDYRVRELRYVAGNAVAYGLPWDAALKAVTINPARAFGIADRAGSLEPGKDADVVVWSGDPFEPLSQPKAIFIKGEEQPLTSRQLQLRDRYKDLNRPYPPEYH